MPRLARLSVPAVLSTVLLVALVVTQPALAAPGAAPVAAPASAGGAADGAHERARAVLDDVIGAFSREPAARATRPSLPGPDEHGRDLTLLLRDLRDALPHLTPAERTTARSYLARPRDRGGDGRFCNTCQSLVLNGTVETSATEHFLVHYQTNPPLLGRNQVTTPSQLAATKAVLEEVWTQEIETLGYRKPLSDAATIRPNSNPDGKIDVFLLDIGDDGYYGYVYSDDETGRQVAPYMVLDNDFTEFKLGPSFSLKVTVAHEFFHAIQYAYDAGEKAWFMEGTATWMEDVLYPSINDYLQYVAFSQVANPLQPVDTTGERERYGAVTFWRYLSEGYSSNSIIKSIWTAADLPRNKNGLTAAKDVLKARGHAWVPAFARSAIWATLPAGTYDDRAGMVKYLRYWAKGTLGKTANDTGTQTISVDHLSSASLYLAPGTSLPTQAKLRVTIDAPSTSLGSAARIQVRYKNGKVGYTTVALSASGVGAKTLTFNRTTVAAVVVTLTNASMGIDNQVFTVRGRIVY